MYNQHYDRRAEVTTVLAFLPALVILDDRGGQLPSWSPKIALCMCYLLPPGVEWLGLRGPLSCCCCCCPCSSADISSSRAWAILNLPMMVALPRNSHSGDTPSTSYRHDSSSTSLSLPDNPQTGQWPRCDRFGRNGNKEYGMDYLDVTLGEGARSCYGGRSGRPLRV